MQIKTYSESANRVLRESKAAWVIAFSFLSSFVVSLLLLGSLFISNSVYFIIALKTYPVFNFPVTLLIFIVTSTYFSYYLYKEAQIQFVNKKFYFSTMTRAYSSVFSLPIAINFGLLLAVFLIHTIYNYYGDIDDEFIYSFSVLLFIFIPICAYYYHGGIRWVLYVFLKNYEKINFADSELLENELDYSMKNNISVSIVLIKIMNMEEIKAGFKKNPKKIVCSTGRFISNLLSDKDIILPLNPKSGTIVWFARKSKADASAFLEDPLRIECERVFESDKVSFGISYSYKIFVFPDEINQQGVREILELLNKYEF